MRSQDVYVSGRHPDVLIPCRRFPLPQPLNPPGQTRAGRVRYVVYVHVDQGGGRGGTRDGGWPGEEEEERTALKSAYFQVKLRRA